jgi:hypothetical protein
MATMTTTATAAPMTTILTTNATTTSRGWTREMADAYATVSNFVGQASSFVELGDVGAAYLVKPFGNEHNLALVVVGKRIGMREGYADLTVTYCGNLGMWLGERRGDSARMEEILDRDRGGVDAVYTNWIKKLDADETATRLVGWHVNRGDRDGADMHWVGWMIAGMSLRDIWAAKINMENAS